MAQSDAFSALTGREERALRALLEARTISGAAEEANVSRRSLQRYLGRRHFKAALSEARREAARLSIARLVAAIPLAIDALRCVVEDEEMKASDRIAAARAILDHAESGAAALDFDDRLDALESGAGDQV